MSGQLDFLHLDQKSGNDYNYGQNPTMIEIDECITKVEFNNISYIIIKEKLEIKWQI